MQVNARLGVALWCAVGVSQVHAQGALRRGHLPGLSERTQCDRSVLVRGRRQGRRTEGDEGDDGSSQKRRPLRAEGGAGAVGWGWPPQAGEGSPLEPEGTSSADASVSVRGSFWTSELLSDGDAVNMCCFESFML